MGVPAHRNLLCLEEKRPPEREGPRERRGEGAEVRGGARGHGRPRRSMQKTQAGTEKREKSKGRLTSEVIELLYFTAGKSEAWSDLPNSTQAISRANDSGVPLWGHER